MAAKYVGALWAGFLIGVGLGSWYIFESSLLYVALDAGLALLIIGAVIRKFLLTICLLSALVFGYWYIGQTFVANEYIEQFGKTIDVEGVIAADSERVERNQSVTFIPDGYSQAVRTTLYQPIAANRGDRVWARGVLEPPENFSEFDYIGYLQRNGVYAVLKKPKVAVLKPASASWRTPLLKVKDWFLFESKTKFETRPGSLIVGMLIGERGNIPKDVSENFARTGLSHVVAVSGFNMTIIAMACASLAWYISRRPSNYLTVLIVLSFSVITGASASVVRAALMALLLVLAQLSGRLYTSVYALLWAAGLMVLHNPRLLAWDIGFQLSATATCGVLGGYWLTRNSAPTFWKNILWPTLGAIIATAPLVAFHFGTFSLVAPLANAVLLPFVPILMLLGALAFLPLVGAAAALASGAIANLFINVVGFFASWPYSSLEVSISPSIVVIYYLFLVGLLLMIRARKRVVKLP